MAELYDAASGQSFVDPGPQHGGFEAELDDAVSGAAHLMRHRGPDEPGTWSDEDVVLGFNRLSIIDITHSHQPLRWGPPDQPDRYVLVFNGEIYNYLELRAELAEHHGARFATDGDGEAIVALAKRHHSAVLVNAIIPAVGHPG